MNSDVGKDRAGSDHLFDPFTVPQSTSYVLPPKARIRGFDILFVAEFSFWMSFYKGDLIPKKWKHLKDLTTVELRATTYQPSKAELEKEFHLDIPDDTVKEEMENFAKASLRPVNIVHKDK